MDTNAMDFGIGDERLLTDGSVVLRPNWNADGRSLVFETRDGDGSRLHRIALDDGVTVALDVCNADAHRVQGRPAFFAIDDFAFVSDRGGSPCIWRCALQRGRLTRLTEPPDGASDFGPATLPDADGRFLFFRKPKDAGPSVHRGRIGSTDAVRLTAPPSNQPWPIVGTDEMVYHAQVDGRERVYRQAIEPEATATPIGDRDEGTAYVTPYPSPDGRHVAITAVVDGTQHVVVMRADGSRRQPITFGSVPAMFPCWSPDGRHVAFVRGDPMGDAPSGRLSTIALERLA